MRVLGLDLGERRIGLSISDPEATVATPAGVLERTGLARDLSALGALIREREVERVVVGLPIHMDGHLGPEAEAARRFAAALSEAVGVKVDLLDERWTSVEAERALRESGVRGSKRRKSIDSVAATILLRTYLARRAAPDAAER